MRYTDILGSFICLNYSDLALQFRNLVVTIMLEKRKHGKCSISGKNSLKNFVLEIQKYREQRGTKEGI